MKNDFSPVRGMLDYMPKEASMRESVRRTILDSYARNGFNLIDTPILESLDFLDSSEGGDNLKLMFKTIKRKDKLDLTKPDLTEKDIVAEGMRYDLTVPLCRFYAGNREKLPRPFKSIQIGWAFRAERPQRGRNRQFTQCDIDIFGDATINAELELLNTTISTLNLLGFKNLTVKINNRQILNALVMNAGFSEDDIPAVCITLDKLDKIAITGVMMELVEKGYETDKINKLVDVLNAVLSRGLDCVVEYGVDGKVKDDLSFLIDTLKKLNKDCDIKFDVSIVRGQGYYTGTVYEIYTEGFSGAIVGGGRYDKMLNKFAGVDIPAVGCSIGFEPITMLLNERSNFEIKNNNLALIYYPEDDILKVYEIKRELMKKYNVSLFIQPKNMKNFYEKIVSVANMVTTTKDYLEGKEIKVLN